MGALGSPWVMLGLVAAIAAVCAWIATPPRRWRMAAGIFFVTMGFIAACGVLTIIVFK